MSKSIYLTLLILTLNVSDSFSQELLEPLQLAKNIFENKNFKQLKFYSTGEYEGRPNAQDFAANTSRTYLLLEQTPTNAVVSMTILDSSGKGLDTYLHFIKEKVWKLEAFRALAMTGMLETMKEEMEKLTNHQIDSLISDGQKKDNKYILFKDREDFDFKLGNTKLILSLDSEIIEHFTKHSNEFNRIKDSLLLLKNNSSEKIEIGEELTSSMKKIFIDPNGSHYSDFQNCITLLIGGILDNTVGYLYCANKNDLPKMNPSNLIMLREIGKGWYIFKTT
jgi:hypothetical protein